MASRFLFNESLWSELTERVAKAKRTFAAVAYLGAGASKLVRLKKGDKLVVDMSLKAVRSGTTDPREVKKLLDKGVEVFSRAGLHAKFFVIDRVVIAGSANISKHARDYLDEAGVLTDDPAAVRRARDTLEGLCTEPVRKLYLETCIAEYRPPRFLPGAAERGRSRAKPKQAKLWILGGLHYADLPEVEAEKEARVTRKAEKRLRDYERCEVGYSHYARRLGFFDRLRVGDQLIICIRSERGFDVYPPARCLGVESYPRGRGKRRYLVLRESPSNAETVSWAVLRRSLPRSGPLSSWPKPKTSAIVDEAEADAILRLWEHGRFKGRKA